MFAIDYIKPTAPLKKNYITYIHYKGGKVLGESNTKEPMVPGAVVEKVFNEDEYNRAFEAWTQTCADIEQRKKADFFAHYAIEHHPKRELFYSKCFAGNDFLEAVFLANTWCDLLSD